MSRSFRWTVSEPPSSEDLDPYPATTRPTPPTTPTPSHAKSRRSPLEWIIDRYHVKTDKTSGIVNDPNDFLREQGRPDAVVDLIKRLVTVSMRT